MIFYGIVLLIIGVIIWGVGRAVAPRAPTFVIIIGEVIGVIGFILLVVGIILLVLNGAHHDVQVGALKALVWG